MSGIFNLFGKKKEEKKVDVTSTINLIRETVSTLEKRQVFIDKNIEMERTHAKEAISKNNKQRAISHIKKVKMYQKEYDNIQGNIFNLETQRIALESQVTSYNIVQAMKASSVALKQGPNPDEISDLMDGIDESIQIQDEIAQELSRPIGPVMDDSELESELEMLESEYIHEISGTKDIINNLNNLNKLPKAKKEIKIEKNTDNIDNTEKELKELEMILS